MGIADCARDSCSNKAFKTFTITQVINGIEKTYQSIPICNICETMLNDDALVKEVSFTIETRKIDE